jgi:zinc protease
VLNTLKRNFDPALDLMADIVINPTFPNEELDRNKKDFLGRIAQETVQPGALAARAFAKVMYGEGHPYAQSPTGTGTAKSVNAITRADLEAFHKANYLPNNAVFVLAGDITMAEAQAKLEKAFKNWKPGTATTQPIPAPKPPDKTTIYVVDKPGAAQSMVFVGNLGVAPDSPDRYAVLLFNNALGGGSRGRLYMNLREAKGYTYGAYSDFTWRRGIGPFAARASVQTKFTKEAVSEFVKELTEIGSTRPLTAEEIAANKDNLAKKYPQAFETMGDIVARMSSMVVQHLPQDYWQTFQDRIRATDAGAIQAAAQKYIHPNALVIVVVGDRATIEPGLKELNMGDVVPIDPATL